jgi:hypothetical protein
VNDRPCKDGNHAIRQTFDSGYYRLRCDNCPVSVSVAVLYEAHARNVGPALGRAFLAAERDWYIKELES